jgi:hypothetical protein
MVNKKLIQEDLDRFNQIMGYNPSKGLIKEEGEQLSMDFPTVWFLLWRKILRRGILGKGGLTIKVFSIDTHFMGTLEKVKNMTQEVLWLI